MFALSIAELRAAGTTVKDYKRDLASDDTRVSGLVKVYVVGLGEGIFWANVFGEVKNKARLYCPPEKLALDGHNYLDILDGEIKAQSSRLTAAELEEQPLGDMLVMGLIKTFPCTGK